MYNRLYKPKTMNNILYETQERHWTEHSIIQLINEVNSIFKKKHLIDLSQAFESVDHQVLISNLKNYEFHGSNLRCIYGNTVTLADIICIVRQGCILGTLLFLMYLNDLKNAPDVLVPIMFADNISLFYSHCINKTFFTTASWNVNRIG